MINRKRGKFWVFSIAIISVAITALFIFNQQRTVDSPNILLIIVDALRPDHLSCYGYKRNTSPNIDQLAEEGVRFTQAIAPSTWTFESVPSILTGTYSPTHQVVIYNVLRNPSIKTFPLMLALKGYQCILWSNHSPLEDVDVKDGFEEMVIYQEDKKTEAPLVRGRILTEQIINKLKERPQDRPFFWYIHYKGCHIPYRPPAPYKNMYVNDQYYNEKKAESIVISKDSSSVGRYDGLEHIPYTVAENGITDPNYYIAQYDGTISYVDTQIGRLIKSLKELGLDKNTVIILTADHGEMLGEHRMYFNHVDGYEESLRVPLIIVFPKLFPENKVLDKQVSLIDIAPTILEIAALDKPSYMEGKSLLHLFNPFRNYHSEYVLSFFRGTKTLRSEEWKLYLADDRKNLYNLKKDPREKHNLIKTEPQKFTELNEKLENWEKRITALTPAQKNPSFNEEDKARLKSLGYLQ